VARVGHHLVICEVSSRNPQGAECREREKLCWLLINSIAKVTYQPRFLLNAYEERHKASYKGTADSSFIPTQDSSVATSHCQWEKPKTVHTASNNRRSAKRRLCVLHKHFKDLLSKKNKSFLNNTKAKWPAKFVVFPQYGWKSISFKFELQMGSNNWTGIYRLEWTMERTMNLQLHAVSTALPRLSKLLLMQFIWFLLNKVVSNLASS